MPSYPRDIASKVKWPGQAGNPSLEHVVSTYRPYLLLGGGTCPSYTMTLQGNGILTTWLSRPRGSPIFHLAEKVRAGSSPKKNSTCLTAGQCLTKTSAGGASPPG